MTRLSFIGQLSACAASGAQVLNDDSRQQLIDFILSTQKNNGGFADRAGNPDSYYSLFAHLILKKQTSIYQKKLLHFTTEIKPAKESWVDACCRAILAKELHASWRSRIRLFTTALIMLRKNYSYGDQAYPAFLALLLFDAFGMNNVFTRFGLRRFLHRMQVSEMLPCPVLAAVMLLKFHTGMNIEKEKALLWSFFVEEQGFYAHRSAPGADLLSTAVAVFALNHCNESLALAAPACLQLAENCFIDGAFVSGTGDECRDSEYTFYGLLALGALA